MAAYMGTELGMAYSEPMSPARPARQMASYEQSRSMLMPGEGGMAMTPPRSERTMSTPLSALQPPAPPVMSAPAGPASEQQQYEQELAHLQREVTRYTDMQASAGRYAPPAPGLFETMWARRRDILKLVSLALVVVLALAFHSSMEYYLKQYILENDMTAKQELVLRFAYPAVILLSMWILKAWSR